MNIYFKKTFIIAITSLLFFSCKKADKEKTSKDSLIGTWESSSLEVRKTSKGVVLSDTILNYLSPADYVYIFNEDKAFEFIANTTTPVKFNKGTGKGTYWIDGRLILMSVPKGGDTNEISGAPHYLSEDKFSIVLSWNADTSVFNSELLLNFNRKK